MINLEIENGHFEPRLNKNFLPTLDGKKEFHTSYQEPLITKKGGEGTLLLLLFKFYQ